MLIYIVHVWIMGDHYSHLIFSFTSLEKAQAKTKEYRKKGYAAHIGELVLAYPLPYNPNIQIR